MSPRAATWLALLGFDVYDYGLGKVDWMAHGLPMEGTAASQPTALSLARQDLATCRRDTPVAEVGEAIESSQYGFALVLADSVVLGRVRSSRLKRGTPNLPAESLMEPGPSTTRPHTSVRDLAASFERSGANTAILTTPAGELLGVVRRDDLPLRPTLIPSGS
jgi:hypothetical protein